MANLGAEVSRIIAAKEKNDKVLLQGATLRADRMLDEIKTSPDMRPRLAEIEMLSQAIHAVGDSVSELHISPQNIKAYFMPFAIRLMTA